MMMSFIKQISLLFYILIAIELSFGSDDFFNTKTFCFLASGAHQLYSNGSVDTTFYYQPKHDQPEIIYPLYDNGELNQEKVCQVVFSYQELNQKVDQLFKNTKIPEGEKYQLLIIHSAHGGHQGDILLDEGMASSQRMFNSWEKWLTHPQWKLAVMSHSCYSGDLLFGWIKKQSVHQDKLCLIPASLPHYSGGFNYLWFESLFQQFRPQKFNLNYDQRVFNLEQFYYQNHHYFYSLSSFLPFQTSGLFAALDAQNPGKIDKINQKMLNHFLFSPDILSPFFSKKTFIQVQLLKLLSLKNKNEIKILDSLKYETYAESIPSKKELNFLNDQNVDACQFRVNQFVLNEFTYNMKVKEKLAKIYKFWNQSIKNDSTVSCYDTPFGFSNYLHKGRWLLKLYTEAVKNLNQKLNQLLAQKNIVIDLFSIAQNIARTIKSIDQINSNDFPLATILRSYEYALDSINAANKPDHQIRFLIYDLLVEIERVKYLERPLGPFRHDHQPRDNACRDFKLSNLQISNE